MANPFQRSDPDLNYQFARDWGAGRLASLRAIFWRQASAGHPLPAEIDVIVIAGGTA